MTYSFLPRTSSTLAAALFSALTVLYGCNEKSQQTPVNTEVSAAVNKVYEEKISAVEKSQTEIRKRLAVVQRAYDEAVKSGAAKEELEKLKKKISSIVNELQVERGKAYQAVRERIKAEVR